MSFYNQRYFWSCTKCDGVSKTFYGDLEKIKKLATRHALKHEYHTVEVIDRESPMPNGQRAVFRVTCWDMGKHSWDKSKTGKNVNANTITIPGR